MMTWRISRGTSYSKSWGHYESREVLRVLVLLLNNFDQENEVSKISGHHSKPRKTKILGLSLITFSASFDVIPNWEYRSFPNSTDPLHANSCEDIEKWIIAHIKKKKFAAGRYKNIVCQHKNHTYNTSYIYYYTNISHSLHAGNFPYH